MFGVSFPLNVRAVPGGGAKKGCHMNRRSRWSRGQIAVVLTLVLPILLGAMALGADFAIIYFNRILLQKAADAAALAGASQLTGAPGSASSVQTAAIEYADGYACLNGITDANNPSATICPSPQTQQPGFSDQIVFVNVTDTQVSVGLKRTVPYFFGKMIGMQSAGVAATATATVVPQGGAPSGLFPVGVQCTKPCTGLANLTPGSPVTFGTKFLANVITDGVAPGNWQWVDVGQGNKGASALGSALQSGSSGSISVGDTIHPDTGNKANSGPAQSGLATRLAACSAAAYNRANGAGSFSGSAYDPCSNGGLEGGTNGINGSNNNAVPLNDPCLVTMPALDFTGCNGSCNMTVEGFVQVYLEQDSTTSQLDGCFVQGSNVSDAWGNPNAPGLGPLAPPILTN